MKKKTTQKINCNIRVCELEYWKGKDFTLLPNTTYILVIDYPFDKDANFEVKVGAKSMGPLELLPYIRKAYDKKYQMAEKDEDDGYWHGIEDLTIEAMTVNHKTKKITLSVGS